MTFLIDAGIPFVRKFKELIYEASDGEHYKCVITDFIYRLFFHALNLDKGNTVYLPPAGIRPYRGSTRHDLRKQRVCQDAGRGKVTVNRIDQERRFHFQGNTNETVNSNALKEK